MDTHRTCIWTYMQKHTHSFVFFLSFYFCYLTRTLRHIRKNIQKVFSALEFDIVWSNYLNAVKPKSTVTCITEALKCFFLPNTSMKRTFTRSCQHQLGLTVLRSSWRPKVWESRPGYDTQLKAKVTTWGNPRHPSNLPCINLGIHDLYYTTQENTWAMKRAA